MACFERPSIGCTYHIIQESIEEGSRVRKSIHLDHTRPSRYQCTIQEVRVMIWALEAQWQARNRRGVVLWKL